VNAFKQLIKAMFFQQAIKAMKTNASDTYNEIFGIFTMPTFGNSAQAQVAPAANDFMAMFTSPSSSGTFNDSSVDTSDDTFLDLQISNATGNWQVDIHVKTITMKADGTLMIEGGIAEQRFVLDQQQLLSGSSFAEGILSANDGELMRMLAKQADVFDQLKRRNSFVSALIQVFAAAKAATLDLGNPQQPKFAMFMEGWRRNPANNEYLKAIVSTINDMQK
jgi:hypothetical protein